MDVIVGDIHDTFGLQPGGLASFFDARNRLLRPGGIVIPRAIQLLVAPVEAATFYAREIDVWARRVHGVDLSVRQAVCREPRPCRPIRAGTAARLAIAAGQSRPRLIDEPSERRHRHSDHPTRRRRPRAVRLLRDDARRRCGDGERPWRQQHDELRPGVLPARATGVSDGRRRASRSRSTAMTVTQFDGVSSSRAPAKSYARFDHSTLNGLLMSPRSLQKNALRATFSSVPQGIPERLGAHPSVLSRELGGETVLLNLESGVYYGLDTVGTRAWNLLTQDRTLADVCSIMVEEFDVPAETLQSDLTSSRPRTLREAASRADCLEPGVMRLCGHRAADYVTMAESVALAVTIEFGLRFMSVSSLLALLERLQPARVRHRPARRIRSIGLLLRHTACCPSTRRAFARAWFCMPCSGVTVRRRGSAWVSGRTA